MLQAVERFVRRAPRRSTTVVCLSSMAWDVARYELLHMHNFTHWFNTTAHHFIREYHANFSVVARRLNAVLLAARARLILMADFSTQRTFSIGGKIRHHWDQLADAAASAVRNVAEELGLPLIDLNRLARSRIEKKRAWLLLDGMHPTPNASNAIWKAITCVVMNVTGLKTDINRGGLADCENA